VYSDLICRISHELQDSKSFIDLNTHSQTQTDVHALGRAVSDAHRHTWTHEPFTHTDTHSLTRTRFRSHWLIHALTDLDRHSQSETDIQRLTHAFADIYMSWLEFIASHWHSQAQIRLHTLRRNSKTLNRSQTYTRVNRVTQSFMDSNRPSQTHTCRNKLIKRSQTLTRIHTLAPAFTVTD